jgi:hypothetical protein
MEQVRRHPMGAGQTAVLLQRGNAVRATYLLAMESNKACGRNTRWALSAPRSFSLGVNSFSLFAMWGGPHCVWQGRKFALPAFFLFPLY